MRRQIMSAGLEMPEEDRVLRLCRELLQEYYFLDENDSDGWEELVTRARAASDAAKGTVAEKYASTMLLATLDQIERLAKGRTE